MALRTQAGTIGNSRKSNISCDLHGFLSLKLIRTLPAAKEILPSIDNAPVSVSSGDEGLARRVLNHFVDCPAPWAYPGFLSRFEEGPQKPI
jgi:hypothetical protein